MMLIRYLVDGFTPSETDAVVVAKSEWTDSYFVLDGTVLVNVPEKLIISKIYPEGINEPPSVLDYVSDHAGELTDVDYTLADMIANETPQ